MAVAAVPVTVAVISAAVRVAAIVRMRGVLVGVTVRLRAGLVGVRAVVMVGVGAAVVAVGRSPPSGSYARAPGTPQG